MKKGQKCSYVLCIITPNNALVTLKDECSVLPVDKVYILCYFQQAEDQRAHSQANIKC